ncbi:NPCBM-associated, NEW3 domain of alpha-galactosidase [Micromonospora pallida]|uniref:NPCBM-associated, NEW3 domain of alpha-galactosidase n=1 Tax=Micromonospora pallida TaxID=145854 RepID=A0A1C6SSM8_9ACTN|nr:NEW3 domain-containing protein [Micromonospora pallida]SCL32511.1 NPCBM-associated, NEW3 domain of alpha-galactosidase [Micromonospora pallida]
MDVKPTLPRRHRSPLTLFLALAAMVLPFGTAAVAAPATQDQAPFAAPLRETDKPDLRIRQVATIEGDHHQMIFHHATWQGGQTYLRDIRVRSGNSWLPVTDTTHRFDEQWLVLSGENGTPTDYYSSMNPAWVGFTGLRTVDGRTVELTTGAPGAYEMTVRWSVAGDNPEASWTLTARRADNFVVGYQSLDVTSFGDVDEVLCGSRQHARVIYGAEALSAWELMTPACLMERTVAGQQVTSGVYAPAEVIPFEHQRDAGADGQPFGMSLRNENGGIQPVAFAPQVGRLSPLQTGQQHKFAFGVYAQPTKMYQAYTDLSRDEYDYSAYRQNIYDTSLTETVHNLVDLTMKDTEADDSETYQRSLSGWWDRAKGFVDTENDRAVRTATSGVLLGAYYLTGDRDLYDKRARPSLEYQVSRNNIGWTPIKENPVYGDTNAWRMGSISGDASTLVPLYEQTRGQVAGLHELALKSIEDRVRKDSRTPVSTPLAAWRLTGNPAYLAEAKAEADRYITAQIDPAYTTNIAENGFQFNYSKGWIELLELYEETGDKRYLNAAYTEAKRFVTQTMVRPVPEGNITVNGDGWIDAQVDRWTPPVTYDYPKKDVPAEEVPAWMVSTNGMTFEQLSTYKIAAGRENPGGGLVMNPIWAPFLLRLSAHTDDKMLADVAHNLVVGRFTNYPGYYYREFTAAQMRPDFPLTGPAGLTSIYYHHIPAQLGLAMDYLISEQTFRSDGRISFPSVFETNYVYFKYHVYGHQPGEFYGEDGVWPYLPKGIVDVEDPQLNWVTGHGNKSLYVSLTNEATKDSRSVVRFDPKVSGVQPNRAYKVEVIRDNGARTVTTMRGGVLPVTVSERGITALVVRDVAVPNVGHQVGGEQADTGSESYHFDDASPIGTARGMLLTRPDGSGFDAYLQAATEAPATLHWSTDGGATWKKQEDRIYPNEWTIPVEDLGTSFRYRISTEEAQTSDATLRLPPAVTGHCPAGTTVCGATTPASPDTTPGDTVGLAVTVRNDGAAALADPTVALDLPAGWTARPEGTQPSTVPAKSTATWQYKVTVAADAAGGPVALKGTAKWTGGEVALTAGRLIVRPPTRLSSLVAAPAELAKPGDSTTVTASVLNVGPAAARGTLRLTPPAGWTISPASAEYEVGARGERAYTFTLTAPANAQRDQTYRVTAALDGGAETTAQVRIASQDIIITTQDIRPRYTETGEWLASGLPGFNGTQSRYSAEGKLGSTATWRPVVPAATWYEVAVWYPSNADTTREAEYVVRHRDGETSIQVDQQQDPRTWRVLGTFPFTAGEDGYVRINVDDPAFHRVSAARFRPVDPSTVQPRISGLTADPVAAPGGSSTVKATVTATALAGANGNAALGLPEGWTSTPASVPVALSPNASQEVSFTITAPAGATVGKLHEVALHAVGTVGRTAVPVGTPDPAAAVVVDNGQDGYTETGGWTASTLKGYADSTTRVAGGVTGAVATWQPTLSAAGAYQVSVWYPTNSTTTAATYRVAHTTGTDIRTVDQTRDAGQWRVLGTWHLDPATAAVSLSAQQLGHHRSDAVRFEPVVPAGAPGS